ncbi:MAG TPA: hypothetical protein VGG44_03585 [Tepidisphaeraceae bacterium]
MFVAILAARLTPERHVASVVVAAQPGLVNNINEDAGMRSISIPLVGGIGDTSVAPLQPLLRFNQSLASLDVAEQISTRLWILPILFPSEWDQATQSWHRAPGWLSAVKEGIKGLLGLPPWRRPTVLDVQKALARRVTVDKILHIPAFTISLYAREPDQAYRLLDTVLTVDDQIIERDTRARIERELAYVQTRLRTETYAEARTALAELELELQRSLTNLNAGPPYAAERIDNIAVSRSIAPKLIAGGIAFVLTTFALFLLLLLFLYRRAQNSTARRFLHAGE